MSPIKIVIDENQDARPFNLDESFFKEELEKVKGLISNLAEKSKKAMVDDNQQDHFHQHNTIAILGPRGVGKTSFLLSLRDILSNPSNFENRKIIWLPSIDPARMEKNEIFLVVVVANILKQIRNYFSGDLSQKIRDKLDPLSRDFAILAPSRVQEEQWKDLLGDPSSFAYELLTHAHSGLNLAESFHKFLFICLKETEAEAFVQPIDDVDSTIEQGWPVLETLRRYLSTPYLITILSGDIRLYQSLVRKQQADKFRSLIEVRNIIKDEPKIMLQTSELVDQISQLTDQYLAKLIPAYYRIHLTPLSVKIMSAAERGEEFLALQYNSSLKEEKNLSEIYNNFRQDLFNIPKAKDKCIEVLKERSWLPVPLLPSATRSMIAFLRVIQPWSVDLVTDKKAQVLEDEKKKLIKALDVKEKAVEALAQVFNNSLYNGGIQTGDLLALKAGKHLEWLAEYCLDTQQKFPEFWDLESLYDDEEINRRVLLLQAFLFYAWKSRDVKPCDVKSRLLYPDGPISFAIKVCFPCWIASTYHLGKDELKSMKLLMEVDVRKRHTYIAAYGLSYIIAKTNSLHKYTIRVKNSTINNISFASRLFMFQPGIGQSSWISIFVGLARLADILSEVPETEGQLRNLLFFLTEPGMSQISVTSSDSLTGRTTNFSATEQTDKIELKLIEYLLIWIQEMRNLKDEQLITPLIVSRTFRRFTRNLEFIYRDKASRSLFNLGEILELRIVALLNSLLIEEVILKKGILDADLELELLSENTKELFKKNLLNNIGYNLHFMSVDTTDRLVEKSHNLIIVAFVGTNLHIRIFDAKGNKIVDKAEIELMSGETLITLKKQLNPLPNESDLSAERKQEIIQDVISIAGHALNIEQYTISYTLAMVCCPLLLIFLKKTFYNFGDKNTNKPDNEPDLFGRIEELLMYRGIAGKTKKEKDDYRNFLIDLSNKLYKPSINGKSLNQ